MSVTCQMSLVSHLMSCKPHRLSVVINSSESAVNSPFHEKATDTITAIVSPCTFDSIKLYVASMISMLLFVPFRYETKTLKPFYTIGISMHFIRFPYHFNSESRMVSNMFEVGPPSSQLHSSCTNSLREATSLMALQNVRSVRVQRPPDLELGRWMVWCIPWASKAYLNNRRCGNTGFFGVRLFFGVRFSQVGGVSELCFTTCVKSARSFGDVIMKKEQGRCVRIENVLDTGFSQ